MATSKRERFSSQPEHHVAGRDYPGEWARQIELSLDKEPRRLVFYGGLFGVFVFAMVISLIIKVVL
jgi:hypothetical protein